MTFAAQLAAPSAPVVEQARFDALHAAFYRRVLYGVGCHWLGVPVAKNPLDLWVFQELAFALKPALVVECGTGQGGSGLFWASILDLLGAGRVVSIDRFWSSAWPVHPRLSHVKGDSVAPETIAQVAAAVRAVGDGPVLVDLDSDHAQAHVAAELEAYSPFVTLGSYVIVEDTNMNGHPMNPSYGPGPYEAVEAFLAVHDNEFTRDPVCERFGFTFNPGGYLQRRGLAGP